MMVERESPPQYGTSERLSHEESYWDPAAAWLEQDREAIPLGSLIEVEESPLRQEQPYDVEAATAGETPSSISDSDDNGHEEGSPMRATITYERVARLVTMGIAVTSGLAGILYELVRFFR